VRAKDEMLDNLEASIGIKGEAQALSLIAILETLLDIRDTLVRIAPTEHALKLKKEQERLLRQIYEKEYGPRQK